jgi:hypothetical protein
MYGNDALVLVRFSIMYDKIKGGEFSPSPWGVFTPPLGSVHPSEGKRWGVFTPCTEENKVN